MDSDEYIRPPGTYYDILPHPVDAKRAIEVAIVQDHRFAFFFWLKWSKRNAGAVPPVLVSLDWHQDLAAPCELECEWLGDLDTSDFKAATFFCWDKLHCQNDGHILAAAYLNLLGDIHVVQKQRDAVSKDFEDINGQTHNVFCHESIDELLQAVYSQKYSSAFFDIDLDYFTESRENCGGGKDLTLVPKEEIEKCLDPEGGLMSWIYPRLLGMTIATEPEFCGGLRNSNYLFDAVSDSLFEPQLLSHCAGWRHHI